MYGVLCMTYCINILYASDDMKCLCALHRTHVIGHINVILNVVFNHTNVKGDNVLFTNIILDIARGIYDEMQTSNLMLQNIWMSTFTSQITIDVIMCMSLPMPQGWPFTSEGTIYCLFLMSWKTRWCLEGHHKKYTQNCQRCQGGPWIMPCQLIWHAKSLHLYYQVGMTHQVTLQWQAMDEKFSYVASHIHVVVP